MAVSKVDGKTYSLQLDMSKTSKTKIQRKKITAKMHDEIVRLSKKGLKEREIAKKVGCGRSTVWDHLNR